MWKWSESSRLWSVKGRAIANLKFSASFTYLMEELGKIQTLSR